MQIRFNDVDVLGHMNNTVYFTLYDTAKADYFAAVRGEKWTGSMSTSLSQT